MVRQVENSQLCIGQVDVSQIKINPKSRDDIPQILKGLQYIYVTASIREPIFRLLEERLTPDIDKNKGRPGMTFWTIFVMGVIRLDLNCDYDRLHELMNNHKTIRQMLGHADFFDETEYQLQTIKDNIALFTPELLNDINEIVVKAGHDLVKKKESEVLHGRCDSFVVETDVHFPTDINLLWDAMRKIIQAIAPLCERHNLSDWRQHQYNIKHVKRLMRIAQNKKRGVAKTDVQKEKRQALIVAAHKEYLLVSQLYLDKALATVKELEKSGVLTRNDIILVESIMHFSKHADRQIDQITRRILQGEVIPHDEKVFSLFEPHTEWISKGKAGVSVELGIRVCVLEDQYQFILYHTVMEKKTDDQVAVSMVRDTQSRFPDLKTSSFDKGFHSSNNQKELKELLDVAGLPRKGKLSKQAKTHQDSQEFRFARRKHSAVESAINALEVHGLDRCLDHGIYGFKRYVAFAVLSRNIQRIGAVLKLQEQKKEDRRKNRHRHHDSALKLAA